MRLYYTRRAFDKASSRFTNNVAHKTSYVNLGASNGKVSKGDFLTAQEWAKAIIKQAKNGHVVIYVHGFNTKQAMMLERLELLKNGLHGQGFEAAVTAFDWPSDGVVSSHAYRQDRKDAETTGKYMILDGIKLLREAKPSLKIHVVAHSMGTHLTAYGWGTVGHDYYPAKADETVFIASDAEQRWMMKAAGGGRIMQQRTHRLTNYFSGEDKVLDGSRRIINGGWKRAGRAGLREWPAPNFRDVSCTDRYLSVTEPRDRKFVHSHDWYFGDDRFYEDLAETLSGKSHKGMTTRELLSDADQRLKP